jgi:hypothetical protein
MNLDQYELDSDLMDTFAREICEGVTRRQYIKSHAEKAERIYAVLSVLSSSP